MNQGEPLPVGHMLDGRYRIHKVLGQGGMGRVYLVNDTRLANRPVAAKEMVLGDGIQEKKAIEDFNREASVLAKLSHPSIPQVIDYFGERGRHYLVMEFVAGGDLQGHLDQLGPKGCFPEAKVLRWARQILDVLQFLHKQTPPIIYRDLKPGNIMIDLRGRAMLIDFGIARFLPPGGRGTQIGSIGYAPPEQYLGKMEARSDLYALAATMHHLLTGRDPQLEPPFSFPPLRQLVPEVSSQTASVVMSALDKDIEKRPKSAREMRDLLRDPGSEDAAGADPLMPDALPSGSPAMGTMATIVLNRPLAAMRSPTPRSALPVPVVAKVATPLAPAAAKSIARMETQRNLNLPAKPQSAPVKSVSSTARTQDLGLKAKASAGSVSNPDQVVAKRAASAKPPASSSSSRVAAALSSIRAAVMPVIISPATPATHETPRPAPTREGTSVAAVSSAPVAAGGNGLRGGAVAAEVVAGAWLVAPGEGAQFGLTGRRMVIGRKEGATDEVDIDLSRLHRGVDRVSRRHAEIIKQGVDYFIRDLGSLNGTYIAGRGRLSRDQLYKLKDRDEVVLGGAKLECRKS
jgi:serine/threonine protein kinase